MVIRFGSKVFSEVPRKENFLQELWKGAGAPIHPSLLGFKGLKGLREFLFFVIILFYTVFSVH